MHTSNKFKFLFIPIIISSSFLFLATGNNKNKDFSKEGNQSETTINNSIDTYAQLYDGSLVELSNKYISSTINELTFTSYAPPEDLISFEYTILDQSGTTIDTEFFSATGESTFSKEYDVTNLPAATYDLETITMATYDFGSGPSAQEFDENFTITIPEYVGPDISFDTVNLTNEDTPSSNDGSIQLQGNINQEIANDSDLIIVELREMTEYDLISAKQILTYGDQEELFPYDITFDNLDSNTYGVFAYSVTLNNGVEDGRTYSYIDSLTNLTISYDEEDPIPTFSTQIINAYSTSPTEAKVTLNSENTSLLSGTLSYSLNGGEHISIDNLNEGITNITFDSLEEGTDYTFNLYSTNDELIESATFSTSTDSIIEAPINEIQKSEITSTSATLVYNLTNANLITNLNYILYEEGDEIEANDISNYQTGDNTLTLNDLKADTTYTFILQGVHTYDSERSYLQYSTFQTATNQYVTPTLHIDSNLNSDIVSYDITATDPSKRIDTVNLDVYGTNNEISGTYDFLRTIVIKNQDNQLSGNISQASLSDYDNVYIVVSAVYKNEDDSYVNLEKSNIDIHNISHAGEESNIGFVTKHESSIVDPTDDSMFSQSIEILLLVLTSLFFVSTLVLSILTFAQFSKKK